MSDQVFGFRLEGWYRGRPIELQRIGTQLRGDAALLAELRRREPGRDDGSIDVPNPLDELRRVLQLVRTTMVEVDALTDQTSLAPLPAHDPRPEPQLSLVSNGQTPVVGMSVAGELDLVTGPRLHEAVPTLVPRGSNGVSLDVARLGFCDATGLASLIDLQGDLRRGGTALRLRHPSSALARILQLTDSRERFDILE